MIQSKRKFLVVALASIVLLGGCATWSTGSVDKSTADAGVATNAASAPKKTLPSDVFITDNDIVDRKYASLGDISVTVNKTTVFHPAPTPELVNVQLKEKAAELGADAVILVRYGQGGISFMSWGSLEGKGRAIKYVQ